MRICKKQVKNHCSDFPMALGNIKNMLNSIEDDNLNHFAYYYDDLDITYVYNGFHSATAGILYKKGCIEAERVNITKLYPLIYFDSTRVYSSITNQKLLDIPDFRFGLLFEVGRLRYNIKSEKAE